MYYRLLNDKGEIIKEESSSLNYTKEEWKNNFTIKKV